MGQNAMGNGTLTAHQNLSRDVDDVVEADAHIHLAAGKQKSKAKGEKQKQFSSLGSQLVMAQPKDQTAFSIAYDVNIKSLFKSGNMVIFFVCLLLIVFHVFLIILNSSSLLVNFQSRLPLSFHTCKSLFARNIFVCVLSPWSILHG